MAAAEGGTVTVFIEYRIDSSHRESFLHHVGAILEETAQIAAVKEHEIMEGTDQPGLFVEVIRVGDSDSAQRRLRYRREPEGAAAEIERLDFRKGDSRLGILQDKWIPLKKRIESVCDCLEEAL